MTITNWYVMNCPSMVKQAETSHPNDQYLKATIHVNVAVALVISPDPA
jgi:hypothetical protein